ncbi:MAG: CdaR family protein [Nitrospiraceae bacterium]|nr:CdaR family protein [Nitrospiraceae bacterium]
MKKKKLLHNLWLKLASVLMAIALWFFVMLRSQAEVSMEVEPHFIKTPSPLILVESRPQAVGVVLRGNERMLHRLKPENIRIYLNLKDAGQGKTFVSIDTEDIKAPPHVAVVSVNPPGVWVTLETRSTTVLPVKADIKGEPADGYIIEKIEITPGKVEAEGAQRELKKLREIVTEPVDISGAKESVNGEINLKLPDKVVSLSPEQVRISVIIRRR